MSSIGEGIDFSQERQKISGTVPSGHFPTDPAVWLLSGSGLPLTQKTDVQRVGEVSFRPRHAPVIHSPQYLDSPILLLFLEP